MLTLALLIDLLGSHVIQVAGVINMKAGIERLIVLDGQNVTRAPGCLLVGTPADRALLPAASAEEPARADAPGLPILWACADAGTCGELEGICTDLPLAALLNQVLATLEADRQWSASVRKALQGGTLQNILAACCADHELHVAVMNPGCRLLGEYGCAGVGDEFLMELNTTGYLSFRAVQKLEDMTHGGDAVIFPAAVPGGQILYQALGGGGFAVARLLLFSGNESRDYLEAWAERLADILSEYFLGGAEYVGDTEFGSFLGDLIEGRITNSTEIEERLKRIKMFGRDRYRIVLVHFPYRLSVQPEATSESTHNIPWNYIINLLTQVFPFSNGAVYRGNILLTVRMPPAKNKLWYDETLLLEILHRYNGYAAISNTSKFIQSLSAIYHQTSATLRLALAMNTNTDQRIFRYEDYSVYDIIEMCAETAREYYGANLVYLCHPAYTTILRYDQEHGANYTDVLIAYLKNERNMTRTAQDLHIHRNTMMYKIETIENIIGFNLDDSSIRERILFSFHVTEYMRNFLHRDVLEVRDNREGGGTLISGNS
jgi:hypothetical protein